MEPSNILGKPVVVLIVLQGDVEQRDALLSINKQMRISHASAMPKI